MEEFVSLASALVINIGTLSKTWIISMHKAAAEADELGKAWVLDPVGVGATNLRTKTATDLVISHKPTVIRGNASEIMALAKTFCAALNVETSGKGRLNSCLVAKTLSSLVYNFGVGEQVSDQPRSQGLSLEKGKALGTRVASDSIFISLSSFGNPFRGSWDIIPSQASDT